MSRRARQRSLVFCRGRLRLAMCLSIVSWAGLACGDDDVVAREDAGVPPSCFTFGPLSAAGSGSPDPDGVGGEADLEVRTDVLRAVFAAVDRPVHIAASGGTLIDLHLLGRSDHMNELSQLGGVSQGVQILYTDVEVVEDGPSRLFVDARGHVQAQPAASGAEPAVTPEPGTDLAVSTRYELRCGEPR